MIKEWWQRASKSYLFNGAMAAVVIGVVASVVNLPDSDHSWATLDNMAVDWDADQGLLQVSLRIQKRLLCRRVVVNKLIRRIVDGDVVPTPVAAVNGRLFAKIQAAPLGTKSVFDSARLVAQASKNLPESASIRLVPGQYMVTVVALCERPDTMGQLLSTDPVQAILIVDPPGLAP